MKTIIAGGRGYLFTQKDIEWLDQIHARHTITEVVSGGASGADSCGEDWAKSNSIPVKVFRADWKTHGKAAGPIRNKQMAEYAEACILFPGGMGTESMRELALQNELVIYSAWAGFRMMEQMNRANTGDPTEIPAILKRLSAAASSGQTPDSGASPSGR